MVKQIIFNINIMTNIGGINGGSVGFLIGNQNIPEGQTVFSFSGFTFIATNESAAQTNFLLKSINMKNSPNTKNIIEDSEIFEGVEFISAKYGRKNIRLECFMIERNGKTYNDLIIEVKEAFSEIRGICKYFYRGELMELECIIEGAIEFDLKSKAKSFSINMIAKPYFESKSIYTTSGSISGSAGIIEMNNNGNRIHPEVEIEVTSGSSEGLAIGETIGNIRYIREYQNGSDISTSNIWLEIKAIEKNTGKNLAAGILPTYDFTSPYGQESYLTDEDISNSSQWFGKSSANTKNYVQLDLNGYFDIEKIQVWHYYFDSRVFKEVKLQVSNDGISWTTIFDSEIEGRYKENVSGKTHYIEEKMGKARGKVFINEEITAGDLIYINFEKGAILKNGLGVNQAGTLPELGKLANISVTGLNKYIYPTLDQINDAMVGSSGSGSIYVNYNEDYYRVGHLFSTNNIDWMKRMFMHCRSLFKYTVEATVTFYTNTSKTTQIHQFKKIFYAGEYEYDIDHYFTENGGNGIDISGYSSIYIELYLSSFSSLPNNDEDFFQLYRSTSGGNGTSYNYNLVAMTWCLDWQMYGLAGDYVPTLENIQGFDFNVKYNNKFI